MIKFIIMNLRFRFNITFRQMHKFVNLVNFTVFKDIFLFLIHFFLFIIIIIQMN
jgi:hypothetical protein